MKIKDKFWRISKQVRNKLIYYAYLDIKKNSNNKSCLLINSMTSKELNKKYQESSDYCVQKIETYTSSPMNNGLDYNYFHVSLTYNSLNNNYHMLVDNKNIDQYIGHNNIVGKYYKGNTIQIGTTTDRIKYNISLNENRFEKKIIGEKKFKKHQRNSSPLDITKSIHILEEENNNNEINGYLDNIKSINNESNYKNIIKDNINTEKIKENNRNKITQKLINKYMMKLKKYCSNLIKTEIRITSKNIIPNKMTEPPSPVNKKKNRNNKNNFGSDKDKPKIEESPLLLNSNKNIININLNIISENKNYNRHKKLKSQTKIHHNIFKFQTKRSFRKHKSNTLDKNEEIIHVQKQNSPKKIYSPKKQKSPKKIYSPKKQPSPKKIYSSKKQSPKKIYSPKKQYSPKKIYSPKNISSPKKKLSRKDNIFEFNSGPVIPTSKFYQKFNKKEKVNDTAGNNKNDFPVNRSRINTLKCNGYSKYNTNNEKMNLRGSNNIKKARLKKSLTINKMLKFKAGELFGKKNNNVKIKDNNKY